MKKVTKIVAFAVTLILAITTLPYSGKAQAPSITITSPKTGDVYKQGDSITITWTSTNIATTDLVDIGVYSHLGTGSVIMLTPSSGTLNDGVETFIISNNWHYGNDYSISIYLHSQVNGIGSSGMFTVNRIPSASSITVTSPNGGDVYNVGDTIAITWSTKNIPISESVGIYLSSDSITQLTSNCGIAWQNIPNTGTFAYVIPDITTYAQPCFSYPFGNHFKINISYYDTATNNLIEDSSDANFTILPNPIYRSLQIISPNTGEIFYPGETIVIDWISIGLKPSDSMSIDLAIKDSLGYHNANLIHSYAINNGQTLIQIPHNIPSDSNYVIHMETGDSTFFIEGISNVFTILDSVPSITITSLNNGGVYTPGQQVLITWNTKNIPTTDSLLFYLSSDSINLITSGCSLPSTVTIPNSGSFVYTIPDPVKQGYSPCMNFFYGNHYKIGMLYGHYYTDIVFGRSQSTSNTISNVFFRENASDESDTTFSIIQGTLAISDVALRASLEKDIVQLHWNSTERVILQRSSTGTDWEQLVQTSTTSYTDEKPLDGISYYRLKVLENDGNFHYSNIEKILYHLNEISVYPNPVQSSCTISGIKSGDIVQVSDMQGRVLFSKVSFDSMMCVDMSAYTKGLYVIKVNNQSTKVIKQ
ncbi:MAG: T9SS type A sorting domain-containing protein [bacterium]